MDFVSLLGGIVLGAAGAAMLDSKSGSGMLGQPTPAPMPEPPRSWAVQVRAPHPKPRLQGGYPVMNRIGGMR